MKTLMAATLAVALMATASVAYAQADDHHRQQGQQSPGGDHRPAAVSPPRNAPQGSRIDGNHTASRQEQGGQREAPAQRHAEAAPQQQRRVEAAPQQQRHVDATPQQRQYDFGSGQRQAQVPEHRQPQNAERPASSGNEHREGNQHADAYRDRRDDGHRQRPSYDSRGADVWTARQYHDGDYDRPRGYGERHWDHGERLPPQYYGREYWIDDYRAFGLFDPPPHLIWVRVDDDALLIDEDTGEIVQIARDVFY